MYKKGILKNKLTNFGSHVNIRKKEKRRDKMTLLVENIKMTRRIGNDHSTPSGCLPSNSH